MKAILYMRKPFIVTGYKVTEKNMDAIARWCQGHVIREVERPFVRVPVVRYTNIKHTEAYVGTIVTLTEQRGQEYFKVCTEEWLADNFIQMPREMEDDEHEKTVDLSRYMNPEAQKDEEVSEDDTDSLESRPAPSPSNVRHLPVQKANTDPTHPFQTVP